MNIASFLRDTTWSTDSLGDYKFRRTNEMCADPKLIKVALGLPAIWYGLPADDVRDGSESLSDLEDTAYARLARDDLSPLERADLQAALSALDDFQQQRNARD